MARVKFILRPDFLEHIAAHEAMPTEKAVLAWIESSGRTMKHGDITKLLQGKPQTISRVHCLVEFMMKHPSTVRALDRKGALRTYLEKRDFHELSDTDLERVARIVSIPLDSSIMDAFLHGPRLFLDGFKKAIRPRRLVRPAHESEVDDATLWMFIECGRLLEDQELTPAEARRAAERHIGIPLEEYREVLRRWTAKEPWTLGIYMDGDDRLGMGVAIPVKEETYNAVRSGSMRPSDIRAADIVSPSMFVIVDGMAMIPAEGRSRATPPNSHFFFGNVGHSVYLAACRASGRKHPIRFLTFKGTEDTAKRAAKFGYLPTGTRMPGTGIEYLERLVPQMPKDAALWLAWLHYRSAMGGPRD